MRRTFNVTVLFLTVTASTLTIILVWKDWYGQTPQDGKTAILFLSILAGVLIVVLIYQEYRYSRKARYAEVLPHLNVIFREVQTLAAKKDVSPDEIRHTSTTVVNQVAAALSLISATKCSACIKVIIGDPILGQEEGVRLKVVTICRDDTSRERERGAHRVNHWIDQNTDFQYLFSYAGLPGHYFLSNNLPWVREYRNTSFEILGTPPNIGIPLIGDVIRDIFWPLSYKSTVVIPICSSPLAGTSGTTIAGYLCVDSRSRGVFSRRYDVDLITAVADCMFEIVYRYCMLRWTQEGGD